MVFNLTINSIVVVHLISVLVREKPHVRGERGGDGGARNKMSFESKKVNAQIKLSCNDRGTERKKNASSKLKSSLVFWSIPVTRVSNRVGRLLICEIPVEQLRIGTDRPKSQF